MKVTFAIDHYEHMFNLGLETWIPKHRTWKRFQVGLMLGPYALQLTFGNRKQYDEQTALLNNY